MSEMMIDPALERQLSEFEGLLDKKEQLLSVHAGLWARFGPQGVATVLRNRQFAVLKTSLRKKDTDAKETALKDAVERSEEWGAFLEELEGGRETYIASKFAIDMLNARIQLAANRLRLLGLRLSIPTTDDHVDAEDGEA